MNDKPSDTRRKLGKGSYGICHMIDNCFGNKSKFAGINDTCQTDQRTDLLYYLETDLKKRLQRIEVLKKEAKSYTYDRLSKSTKLYDKKRKDILKKIHILEAQVILAKEKIEFHRGK